VRGMTDSESDAFQGGVVVGAIGGFLVAVWYATLEAPGWRGDVANLIGLVGLSSWHISLRPLVATEQPLSS
jgi:hypothetical protein